MYNFFTDKNCQNNVFTIDGKDFNHIVNVLRMNIGEKLLISHNGTSSLCEISEICPDYLTAKIICEDYQGTELPISIYLFQGLPKADKLELIIQKAVELGVSDIIPVQMKNSVVRIEDKKIQAKTQRWQAISESGAKQSKRNIIPKVHQPISVKQSLEVINSLDLVLIPYENKNGMQDTLTALSCIKSGQKVGVFIGPEGGFDQSEIDILSKNTKTKVVSLGKRILRTETAAITALSMIMLYTESKL